jgi:transposase
VAVLVCASQSSNTMKTLPQNPQSVYAGVDIAKASLQLHLQARHYTLPNTAKGHGQLIKLLRAVPGAQVVCEATGGYERPMVAALQVAELPVSVMNPGQVRHFAQAQGRRAKNDPLDAATLSAFGQSLRPAPTPIPDAVLAELRQLLDWRRHLQEQLIALTNRAEHLAPKFVVRQQAKLARHLEGQIAAVEAQLRTALARSPHWQAQIQKLTTLAGVGFLTALATLSQLPELGRLNRRQVAALAGLAPWTRQSGPWDGQRHIGGGRAGVRRALYMAAVAVARMKHTVLGRFYEHLRAVGKPAKVALTAVMRRLLIQMNQLLKPA